MSELVSCIMATANRRRFIPQALACFAAQTWPHRELIVVDDGELAVGDLCSGAPRVKYIRLDRPTPTGAKLNLGIENASGSILQKIDDDDYYAPGFLATAAARIQSNPSRAGIAAWDCFLILRARSERQTLYFSGNGWLAGGTLCFRREVWAATPFRAVVKDEDAYFIAEHAGPFLRIRSAEEYVLVRHGGNTWKRFAGGAPVEDWTRTLEVYPKRLDEVVSADAARFYAGLRRITRSVAV